MNWEPPLGISDEPKEFHCTGEICHNFYHEDVKGIIKGIYVAAVFLWIVAIFLLDLLEPDIFVWFFVFIPIIIFGINILNIDKIKCEIEDEMFRSNFLYFGFLITIILINWKMPIEGQNKSKFFKLVVVAFLLLMISLVDIWVEKKYLSIVKHFKTILHTSATVLFALALYEYYQSYYDRSYLL